MIPDLNKKIFSILDARNSFWQVSVTEKSRCLTMLKRRFGRYRWLRLPFGMSSASEEYQRRMNDALSDIDGVKIFVEDDMLVYDQGHTLEHAIFDHESIQLSFLNAFRSKVLNSILTKYNHKMVK